MKAVGLLIIAAGIILTIFTTFRYTSKEKIIDIGKLEISAERPNYLRWSPLLGIAIIGVGGFVLFGAYKNKN